MKTILLAGGVGTEITEKIVSESLPKNGDVTFEVNSGGGYYDVGLAIYNLLRKYQESGRGRVVMDVLSMAGSAMATIVMAPTRPEDRIMREGSRIFVHRPIGGVQGNSEEMGDKKEELESLESDMERVYSAGMGISIEKAKELMSGKGTYISAGEAVKMGFATMKSAPNKKVKNYWKEVPENQVPAIFANLGDEFNPSEVLTKFVTTAWNDSRDRFTIEQLLESCPNAISAMLNQKAKESGKEINKAECSLFYKEPEGGVNINGVRAAIATVQVQDLPEAIKNSARNELESEIQKFKKSEQSKNYNWQSKIEIIQTYKGKEQTFLYSSEEIKMSKKLLDKLGVTTLEDAENAIEELQKKAEKKEDDDTNNDGIVDASVKAFMDKTNESINTFKSELEAVKAEGASYKKKSEIQERLLDEASEFKNKSILAERKKTLDTLFQDERKISPVQLDQAKADFVDIELDKVGETESLYQYAIKSYKLNKPDESGELRGSGETPEEIHETASGEINAKVKALREKDKELSFKDALEKVKAESPKLFEKYSQEIYRTR